MMICTFIGNRDCESTIKPRLEQVLINLITEQGADLFYVGNHGAFDRIVANTLKKLQSQFPHIRYFVVLAYYPPDEYLAKEHPTILADGVETVLHRFRIVHRNKWMIHQADTVISYVFDITGKARDFTEYAQRRGKRVIQLFQRNRV